MTPPNHPNVEHADEPPPAGTPQEGNSAVGRVRVPTTRPGGTEEPSASPRPEPRGRATVPSQAGGAGRARVPGLRIEPPAGPAEAPLPEDGGQPSVVGRATVPVPRLPAEHPLEQPLDRGPAGPPSGRVSAANYLPPQSYLVPPEDGPAAPPQGPGQPEQGPAGPERRPAPPERAAPPRAAPPRAAPPRAAAGRAKVGAFEDTGTFHAIQLPPERADLAPEAARRRVEVTGSFPQVNVYDYERYSTLTGPIQDAPPGPYKVAYRKLPRRRPIRTFLLCVIAFGLEIGFFGWLVVLGAHPDEQKPGSNPILHSVSLLHWGAIVLVVTTVVTEGFRLASLITLVASTFTARDPVPVWPDRQLRVAFLTTIVPGKEPLEMVEHTLKAALKIRHSGPYDVWLLDEGDDDEVKAACARLGVHHFTRRNVPEWNTTMGPHKSRTKHGNYNAWIIEHGADYDVFMSVDPDHAPLANYAERMLGYFRDPDVAFVVGPQVYGNYDNIVTKSAESQQFMFHAIIQRAGNRFEAPMLVGTNNAIRISAIMGIDGLQDSITEDFATGLLLHGKRNPDSGKRWKSVYTPDVLAVGEGPSSWTDYFTQQHRWSRGTHEIQMQPNYLKLMFGLGFRRLLFYTMLMLYYPFTALGWIIGAFNALLYLGLDINGVKIPIDLWLMLYVDAGVFQTVIYLWNRRHNVSPHEPPGSSGLSGGFISLLCSPIFASSYIGALLRRKSGFVITPKGESASADRLLTFRKHLQWTAFYVVILALGVLFGRIHSAVWSWTIFKLVLCIAPVVMWQFGKIGKRRKQRAIGDAGPAVLPVHEMEKAA